MKWKKVLLVDGYEVSDSGLVRSTDGVRHYEKNGTLVSRRKVGKFLTQYKARNGYLQVALGCKFKNVYVHRLVLCSFNDLPFNIGMKVNHKNGKKDDNRLCNLEFCTTLENLVHSRTFLRSKGKSLNIEQVEEIIKLSNSGMQVSQISCQYKVSRQAVSKILNGTCWSNELFPALRIIRERFPPRIKHKKFIKY